MPKVFLIGMPGSGKSTIGKKLAEILDLPFLDFDAEIERSEGATVKAIFSIKGEDYFRQIEAQVLSKLAKNKENLVIASGGGTPCFYNGLELMKSLGTTVFIDISPEVIIERLKTDTARPLLEEGVEKNINLLFEKRIGLYSKAHIKIEADNASIDDLVTRIVEELNWVS